MIHNGSLEADRAVLVACIESCQAEVDRGGEWARVHLRNMTRILEELDVKIARANRRRRIAS